MQVEYQHFLALVEALRKEVAEPFGRDGFFCFFRDGCLAG
jgi:hypothetical protein